MQGLVEADPLVVGLVIVAVCIAAVAYVVGRMRGRGPGPSGRGG